jgi:endogenous inhibitor of DNA gyrase (YacG/DUF329 family)
MKGSPKHKKTLEEEEKEIKEGNIEEEVYSEAGREEMTEDEDEMSDLDEGFMKGYDEGSKMVKCPACGKIIEKDFVEREINDEIYRFCCEDHAEKYAKSHAGGKEDLNVGEDEEESGEEADDLEDIEEEKKALKKRR